MWRLYVRAYNSGQILDNIGRISLSIRPYLISTGYFIRPIFSAGIKISDPSISLRSHLHSIFMHLPIFNLFLSACCLTNSLSLRLLNFVRRSVEKSMLYYTTLFFIKVWFKLFFISLSNNRIISDLNKSSLDRDISSDVFLKFILSPVCASWGP